MNLIQMK